MRQALYAALFTFQARLSKGILSCRADKDL